MEYFVFNFSHNNDTKLSAIVRHLLCPNIRYCFDKIELNNKF